MFCPLCWQINTSNFEPLVLKIPTYTLFTNLFPSLIQFPPNSFFLNILTYLVIVKLLYFSGHTLSIAIYSYCNREEYKASLLKISIKYLNECMEY